MTDLLNTAPNARFITVQLPKLSGVMARNGSIDYAERVAPGVTRLFGHLDASVEATDPNATPTFSLYVNHRSKTVQGHIRGKKYVELEREGSGPGGEGVISMMYMLVSQ